MSDDLTHLERQLEKLEAAVVQEYERLQLAAAETPQQRVVIPEERLDDFTRELRRLQNSLYATGEVKVLRLVSEQHDALRIRMIYLQHLLEREIPRPYVEEVLQEYTHARHYGAAPPAARPAPTQPRRSLLGRVFQREESKPSAPPPAPRPSGNDARLIYLHKLMEEDRMQLLKPAERPPTVAAQSSAPDSVARFSARDYAEAHLGVRVQKPAEKIARTPEELRAKLAQREKAANKDPK